MRKRLNLAASALATALAVGLLAPEIDRPRPALPPPLGESGFLETLDYYPRSGPVSTEETFAEVERCLRRSLLLSCQGRHAAALREARRARLLIYWMPFDEDPRRMRRLEAVARTLEALCFLPAEAESFLKGE